MFESLPPAVSLTLGSLGADITLLIDSSGSIIDVAYCDPEIDRFGADDWPGRSWVDTVTSESVDKIRSLIDECAKTGVSRSHQVNHPGPRGADLPIEYVLRRIEGFPYMVAYGTDLRQFAEVQQQLIQVQFELEREYRRVRESEARYRVIYQKMDSALLVVDGETRRIIDGNAAAGQILGIALSKLVGDTLVSQVQRDSRERLMEALAESRSLGQMRTLNVTGSNGAAIELRISPYRENGKINHLVSICSQVEEDHPTRGLTADKWGWTEAVPEAQIVIDAKGAIFSVNNRFLDMIHLLSRNLAVGRNVNNWLGASSVDMQVLSSRLRDEGEVRQFLTVVRDDLGSSRPVRLSATRIDTGGDPLYSVIVTEQGAREMPAAAQANGMHGPTSDFSELIGRVPLKELIRESADVIEKLCIEAALTQTENNRAAAADLLGLSRQSLYLKLKRYGLEDYNGRN
ncbi:MAG: transcriptional regulator PpsR [Hoeflea sp.]|uniref:transcriptional regulator PpsR n=1 Tax=Hoeflea sp. TaxID=1940281 RepID=UPI001DABBB34|nr:transcriptional regulator PpsR [Hoeflea sp.]MBU4527865.1 transcriptional regulator PpsR [Alphaproteobacteria bacterium]MBU4546100.1 transcriptional regulator PpsR [Alphaproteobacteria bacterium]MBU4553215.1 transcriptional regulator PpsR [Alphaproteobacteria bacterium]MBV1724287.1 transcriptional regulator PpsR [Hoeflea sp.]MBV1759972.1 transcriptional regulator PpsR [Hoeflea sp.]